MLSFCVCFSDSEEDEFVDAFEHQLEERELTVALPHSPSDMMHRSVSFIVIETKRLSCLLTSSSLAFIRSATLLCQVV